MEAIKPVSSRYNPKTRVFANDFLESMTRTDPRWPAMFWIPVSALLVYTSWRLGMNPWLAAPLFVLGALLWTFAEYLLHRWVFHWIPPDVPWLRRFYYLVHQVHHEVAERDRLVMPVPYAILLGVPFFAAFWAIFGPVLMWATFGGFIVGYLAYDYGHYLSHFSKSQNRWLVGMRRRHLQHHHAFHDRWYGVSTPIWDYVFRTNVKRGDRPSPEHAPVEWHRPNFVPDEAKSAG
jgi:sterol desaturase/sphingolipid hydroxylase (fatty acid hydroxylase superfamily)